MPRWTRVAVGCALVLLSGCTGVQVFEPGKAPPAENQSGWEELPEPEEEELAEEEGAEAAAEGDEADGAADEALAEQDDGAEEAEGPATLVMEVTVKGEPVPAAVRLLDGDQVVARGKSGEPITAPPGRYAIEVAIEDDAVLADRPTKRIGLALRPGATVNQPMSLPWAAIQLRVRVNGKVNRSAKVDILRDGEVLTTLQSDKAHVMFSPGRYDARVHVGSSKIEAPELLFPEGATRTVPVDVQM